MEVPMRNFKFVFWFVDQWDARFDHMCEWTCQAESREDASRQFVAEWGDRHSVQFVVEMA
jgi:hypothetical protein